MTHSKNQLIASRLTPKTPQIHPGETTKNREHLDGDSLYKPKYPR